MKQWLICQSLTNAICRYVQSDGWSTGALDACLCVRRPACESAPGKWRCAGLPPYWGVLFLRVERVQFIQLCPSMSAISLYTLFPPPAGGLRGSNLPVFSSSPLQVEGNLPSSTWTPWQVAPLSTQWRPIRTSFHPCLPPAIIINYLETKPLYQQTIKKAGLHTVLFTLGWNVPLLFLWLFYHGQGFTVCLMTVKNKNLYPLRMHVRLLFAL